ncbi:Uncharacterized protein OBRU01_09002 [Operophtera brumata]|uniref:Dynein intermediate chain 3, ciliary n=1 Tax=Operophtera brumata TaxID=104452 RepID=A0A0L7LG49_OPEBR|nr:Uncharacterized protein OBRU01_09002 [Operophtera brumata]
MPYIKSTYEYTKLRKSFGRQLLFQDVPAHMLDSIYPNRADQNQYMLRNPVHREVQATIPKSQNEANTNELVIHEQSMNHTEGGWPRDIHIYNEEHIARYCRRIMHEESYIKSVLNFAPVIEHYIDQNNAIEMYQTYFNGMRSQKPVEKYSIRIANVFRDQFQRPVSCVVWTNEQNSKLAVAYSNKTLMSEPRNDIENDCYLWDVNRQTSPIQELKTEHSCWQLACSPVDPHVLLVGLENGTVGVFDLREGVECTQSSSIYNSHRGPVTSLLYTHSRTNTEFFTGSPDGHCLWWDCRDLTAPTENLPMSVKIPSGETPNLGNAEGVSRLEFDNGLPTKFLCGTESGLVINVNRMGREHSERLISYWDAHVGPVRALQRSPCTLRMFLSCGDSTVRIWSEEVRTAPIIVTRPYRYQVTDAAWAPLRYSSYMSICAGGYFYSWDLLRKSQEPIATMQISKDELTRMTPHSEGRSIAIGDSKGALHLIQLSDNMTELGKRDKALTTQLYERETRREHILDNRMKEIRLKINIEKKAAEEALPEQIEEEEEPEVAAEEEYFRIVNEELRFLENETSIASLL